MATSTRKNRTLLKRAILFLVAFAALVGIFAILMNGHNLAVLAPAGLIASKQKTLIVITTLLGLFVVIPVFILLFTIAWKYREGNTKAKYTPDIGNNRLLEGLWWGIPATIIIILSIITWQSTHELDPYKAISSSTKALNVQVVSLQWKWLFIYPDLGVASVNYLAIPEKTPIHFEITSDAPMNSFWIPNLGGQVYAMSGMSTQLQLIADGVGIYRGSSANMSGEGFAGMTFNADSMSTAYFTQWVKTAKQSADALSDVTYAALALPSKNVQPKNYGSVVSDLYNNIMMKSMMPDNGSGMSM